MLSKFLLVALAAAPLVAAHGKIAQVVGDAGGNGTALGILGAVVPGPGPNDKTELDTTVFASTKIKTDGLGKTEGNGANTLDMLGTAMALSGTALPQVSPTNGSVSGVFHVVTTDGAGPLKAVLDTTGTGAFSKGVVLQAITNVPGFKGNLDATQGLNSDEDVKRRSFAPFRRALEHVGLVRRGAVNVNEDWPMAFAVPDNTVCKGTVGGVDGVCLIKIANSNKAGPFGGVVAVQIAGSAPGVATSTAAAKANKKQQRGFRG